MQGEDDMKLKVDITKKLKDFELNVKLISNSQTLALLGESGSGKSMTLKCISGIETPDSGEIILNDRILYSSEKRINIPIRERKVGFLFQNYALFPNMTVEENIGFGLNKNIPKLKKQKIIKEKIEAMQLNGMEKRYPFELSGGQQQRAALARALAVEPDILLLDEPFSALDEYLRNYMTEQLKAAISEFNGTTVFVTHNMEEAYQLCSNIAILSKGKVNAYGDRENIFNSPPTYSAAKLTGCKNISKIKKISSNVFEAVDWNCKIASKGKIEDSISYVGMRAHYFELAEKYSDKNENIFNCWPVFMSEALFRVKVYIKLNEEPSDTKDYHIIWDISKEEWNQLKDKTLPWKIHINPEKFFFMKD